jgi:hypothetical protein
MQRLLLLACSIAWRAKDLPAGVRVLNTGVSERVVGDFPDGASLQVKSSIDDFHGAYLCNVVQVVVLAV